MNSWIKTGREVVLIRLPNWLGDAVMASGIISALKEKWPEIQLLVVAPEAILQVFADDPRIHGFASSSHKRSTKSKIVMPDAFSPLAIRLKPIKTLCRKIRYFLCPPPLIFTTKNGVQFSASIDLCVRLTHSFSSTWHLLLRARSPMIGTGMWAHHSKGVTRALGKKEGDGKTMHLVEQYSQLLQPLIPDITPRGPKLFVDSVLREQYIDAIQKQHICINSHKSMQWIAINSEAAYGPAKCWPKEYFIDLTLKIIQNPNMACLFLGDAQGKDSVHQLVDAVAQGIDSCMTKKSAIEAKKRIVNLAGKTSLKELMVLLQACDMLITGDSGPMHLRSALAQEKHGLIALFGSTNPAKTGPLDSSHVLYQKQSCSPCYLRKCPIDFRCMRSLSVDRVYQELLRQLA